jgi:hypothetical protein
MKSLLVVVEVHKSLPEVKSSTTSRVLQQGLWMECTHTSAASFLERHPLMELIIGTQHCENISMSNK